MARYNSSDRVLTEEERNLLETLMDNPWLVLDVNDWDILCDMAGETPGSKFSNKRIEILLKHRR